MNNHKYLSGTSILPYLIDRPVVFLVEMIMTKDIESRLKNTGYEILPGLWKDKNDLNKISDYLDRVYERLSAKIGQSLSQIHGVNYPASFWEIPMASWLLHYIQALYDRYARLRRAVEIYGRDDVSLLACRAEFNPPASFIEFIKKTSIDEETASFFYGEVAREMGITVSHFILPKQQNLKGKSSIFRKNTGLFSGNFCVKVYYKIKDMLSLPLPIALLKGDKVLIVTWNFNKKEKFNFIRELRASFLSKKKIDPALKKIDRAVLLSIIPDDEFEAIAIRLLPEFMPSYLLEDFSSYHKHALRRADFRAYFSENHWYFNILFCYAASLGRLRGAKIIGCQHGGGYGQFERSHTEFIERKFSDFYITWGWRDNLYGGAKLIPLPQPVLSRSLNQHNPKLKYALWASTTVPKQLIRFTSYLPQRASWYLNSKKQFISHLEKDVRLFLVYRPYPNPMDYAWALQEQNIFNDYPEVGIENRQELLPLLKKVKLYLCDHQSTTFMQALAMNTPTILFWQKDLINERENASAAFDLLRDAGILFHDPVKAARQVNAIWGDVQGWWRNPARQNARLKFMDAFCRAETGWGEKWIRFFKDIITDNIKDYTMASSLNK